MLSTRLVCGPRASVARCRAPSSPAPIVPPRTRPYVLSVCVSCVCVCVVCVCVCVCVMCRVLRTRAEPRTGHAYTAPRPALALGSAPGVHPWANLSEGNLLCAPPRCAVPCRAVSLSLSLLLCVLSLSGSLLLSLTLSLARSRSGPLRPLTPPLPPAGPPPPRPGRTPAAPAPAPAPAPV